MTASTGAVKAAKLGYWMNLPEGWLPLDLSDGQRIPTAVAELIDERAAADPNVAEHRAAIERQVAAAVRAARTKELSFAAILATSTSTGLPIAASLALTKHRSPDGADAGRILAGLGKAGGKTNTLFRTPFAGTAVRSSYPETVAAEGPDGETQTVQIAVVQYFLPMPSGRDILVASGATPTLPMAAAFGELFDAIMSTFQFVSESDQ